MIESQYVLASNLHWWSDDPLFHLCVYMYTLSLTCKLNQQLMGSESWRRLESA